MRVAALISAVGVAFVVASCGGTDPAENTGATAGSDLSTRNAANSQAAEDTSSSEPATESTSETSVTSAPAEDPQSPPAGALGRKIVLTEWNMVFALPERFDVTDVRIIYADEEQYDLAVISSKSLPSKLNTDMCRGGTLELGSFVEVVRFAEPGEDRMQIGNYYYLVEEGPAGDTCYDDATYQKYYAPDVTEAVRSSLQQR